MGERGAGGHGTLQQKYEVEERNHATRKAWRDSFRSDRQKKAGVCLVGVCVALRVWGMLKNTFSISFIFFDFLSWINERKNSILSFMISYDYSMFFVWLNL